MTAAPPGDARPFQDILDGYFTLRESLRQMAARQGFDGVTLTLTHAPVMDVRGLAADEPVPLHLRDGHAGLIDTLVVTALFGAESVLLLGAGAWRWFDDRADPALPADVRLGEPAFVRGVGWSGVTQTEPTTPQVRPFFA
ncbi:hypothetical protein [Pararhodobacter zhoushanensis]|uniref:hypothetical protein n=1 Tax=Pararhodobacter zhoushanensis TaxID=2479545 RepID=UPI000F8EB24F|nr:hypothetical protein [Pararhodobacter zhoushanensis]